MPSVLAKMAAGTSAARVNRAVLRPCRGLIPRAWSRWASASSVSALPGLRPGKSQGEETSSRLLPGGLRPAASPATRVSSGAGRMIGRLPRRRRVRPSSCRTCLVVRAVMTLSFWA